MSKSENTRLHWFLGAALVLAGSSGVLFVVLKARAAVQEAEERREAKRQYEELGEELERLEWVENYIRKMPEQRARMSPKQLAEFEAFNRREAGPSTGGQPVGSLGHLAYTLRLKAEVEEKMKELDENFRAKYRDSAGLGPYVRRPDPKKS